MFLKHNLIFHYAIDGYLLQSSGFFFFFAFNWRAKRVPIYLVKQYHITMHI